MNKISQEDRAHWLSLTSAHIAHLEAHHLILNQAAALIAQNATTEVASTFRDEMRNMVARAACALEQAKKASEMMQSLWHVTRDQHEEPAPANGTATREPSPRKKRRSPEPLESTELRHKRRRKIADADEAPQRNTVDMPPPTVDYDDISAEVSARIKAKEEKRKRRLSGGEVGSKRKRTSAGDAAVGVATARVRDLRVSEDSKLAMQKRLKVDGGRRVPAGGRRVHK